MLRFYSPCVMLSAWCVLSTLAQNSRHLLTSLPLCEVTPVCVREGVARKTAYSGPRPCVTCCVLRECGGGGGGESKREGRVQGVPWCPGPGLGGPNNLHTLTTPSCRDLRTPYTQLCHFIIYFFLKHSEKEERV